MAGKLILGIISDTHGELRSEVFDHFRGVDHIIHGGDVGDPDILIELAAIAPVTAVWGNVDDMSIRASLREEETIGIGDHRVSVFHGHQLGSPTPRLAAARFPDSDLVVFGHSHRPEIVRVGKTLCVNPGSAGPARFRLPVTVAIAELKREGIVARLVSLLATDDR